MAGDRLRICAAIVRDDPEAIAAVAPLVDLYEVRIDLIGDGWREVAGRLTKPWIACNRMAAEGGAWQGSEAERIGELYRAVELGAGTVDIELATHGLAGIVRELKGRAECLLSYHNVEETPPAEELRNIVGEQVAAGADICKVVTTARSAADSLAVLELIVGFPRQRVVSFAMGPQGRISRIMCPLIGGCFTYASIGKGRESAAGQITVADLRTIYGLLGYEW